MKVDAIYFEGGQPSARKLDLTTSQQLAGKVIALPGKCYENSYLGMLELKDSVQYVEGYAVFLSSTFCNLWHHGWLERNGEIIDDYPGLDWQRYVIIYFPGRKYSHHEAVKEWGRYFQKDKRKTLPFAINLRTLIFAIKKYHEWSELPGSWLFTAGKLALVFAMSR